jgi:hypothetical protein
MHQAPVNPFPQGKRAKAKIQFSPMSKDPSDLGVDLRIAQLCREGEVETTWPRLHPQGHLSPMKRLDPAAEKGPWDLHAHQSSLQQSPNDLLQGLQPAKVCLSHTVPPVGLGDGAITCECMEPYFAPPDQRVRHHVIPDFASKAKYSSHVCPRIIYSTHTDIKCSQINKCHE